MSWYLQTRLSLRAQRPGAVGDQGSGPLFAQAEIPVYKPVSEAVYRAWQEQYGYERPPLDAKIVEAKVTDDWRREKIKFVGAEGERAIAYTTNSPR